MAQQETSQLTSKLLTTVFGLETRLHVRMSMRKQLENGILCKQMATAECCKWFY